MRCKACDVLLSEQEATRKSPNNGEYVDLCNVCFAEVQAALHYSELPGPVTIEDTNLSDDY